MALPFDALYYPYPARRSVVFARHGMIASSHPLAAQAGLEILKRGGNAVDAAVACAASLTVLEPTANGIGGDAFAQIWHKGKLYGLNSSGPAPKLLSLEALKKAGHSRLPNYGMLPVTVPGIPAAWAALVDRFGALGLSDVMRPAIAYAEHGAPVAPVIADCWAAASSLYAAQKDACFASWFAHFAPRGQAPRAGELLQFPDTAKSLEAIASSGARDFYSGKLAERIHAFSEQHGGYLRGDDLAAFTPEWVEPLKASYNGYEVWELPPNGHGLVALMALRILDNLHKEQGLPSLDSPQAWHLRIEALKLAFADGLAHIADPRKMRIKAEDLLDDSYIAARSKLVSTKAIMPPPGRSADGGTVYLATADAEGNMVSYIQSNYTGFGSGMLVPGTGIALNNRALCFSLDPAHPNCLAPGARPYQTIIPGFLTKNGEPQAAFGVMGAYLQPQGHLMLISNMLDYGLNPQAALDAPRCRWEEGLRVELESAFPSQLAEALVRMGHDMRWGTVGDRRFGRGQLIWRNQEDGVLAGGSESRCDGQIAAW